MIPIRDENPTYLRPYVTWLLVLVNVVVFVYELMLAQTGALDAWIASNGLVPSVVLAAPLSSSIWTVFSSMFIHGGVMHIAGNMLYLLIFGDNIEDRLGHGRFLIFYLAGGVAAAAAQMMMGPDSNVPMVGASGAIAAVLGAYLVEFPRARVRSLLILGYWIRMASVPAVIVLGLWFVLQFFSGFLSVGAAELGGVAYFAHLGGFIAGVVLVKIFAVGRPKRAPLNRWRYR